MWFFILIFEAMLKISTKNIRIMSKSTTETPRPTPREIHEMIIKFQEDIGKTPKEKSNKDLAKDIESIKSSFVDPKLESFVMLKNFQKAMGDTNTDLFDAKIGDREKEYMTTRELRDGIGAYLRSLTQVEGGRKLTKGLGFKDRPPEGFETKLDGFFREHGIETGKAAEAMRERGGSASSVDSEISADSRVSAAPAPSTDLPKPDAKASPAAPSASAGFAGAIRSAIKKHWTADASPATPSNTFTMENPIGRGRSDKGKRSGGPSR